MLKDGPKSSIKPRKSLNSSRRGSRRFLIARKVNYPTSYKTAWRCAKTSHSGVFRCGEPNRPTVLSILNGPHSTSLTKWAPRRVFNHSNSSIVTPFHRFGAIWQTLIAHQYLSKMVSNMTMVRGWPLIQWDWTKSNLSTVVQRVIVSNSYTLWMQTEMS